MREKSAEQKVTINVVSQYKHLGCIVEESGNLVPEARNREKSALTAFAPIAKRILHSIMLGMKRRIRLAWSLVMSRLLFGVHTWSNFNGQARGIIYSVYMRVWRRVAGDPRYCKTRWNDLEVRTLLGVPSLDCYMRQKRLIYLSRLAGAKFDALHAVLQQKGNHGEYLPWVNMLIDDLCVLKNALPGKLESMPDPRQNLDAYWRLARDHQNEWRALVVLYHDVAEDPRNIRKDKRTTSRNANHSSPVLECGTCGEGFADQRRLATHQWAKHGTKSDIRTYVGDISLCPICKTDFVSRARLIKHLSERRARAKHRRTTCRQAFMSSVTYRVTDGILLKLESRDKNMYRCARKAGHMHVIAEVPCKRTAPSILKRQLIEQDWLPTRRLRQKTAAPC